MARSRGGRGGSASCQAGAFEDTSIIAGFSFECIFFAIALGIIIWWGFAYRKVHPHAKKLVGVMYIKALVAEFISLLINLVATALLECGRGSLDLNGYYNLSAASDVFYMLANYLLLVLVVWAISSALRERLGAQTRNTPFPASGHKVSRIMSAVILGFMGCFTVAFVAIDIYNYVASTSRRRRPNRIYELNYISISYWSLYILFSLAGAGMSFARIKALRSRGLNVNRLLLWTTVLTLSMLLWPLFIVMLQGARLANDHTTFQDEPSQLTMLFFQRLFRATAFIALILLAKSPAFGASVVDAKIAPPVYAQSAYAPVSQQYGQASHEIYGQGRQEVHGEHVGYGPAMLDGRPRHVV